MVRLSAFLTIGAICFPLGAQTGTGDGVPAAQLAPPAAAGKAIEITGTVGQIHIVAGQGMPYFELKRGADITRVYLGPMPFLIAENFNPKAGQEVAVKGYKLEDRILASQITFVAEKRTVRFRDDHGWPVWRGGFGRGRGR
jgi:hypothetical protein